jgi:hypothetical protein
MTQEELVSFEENAAWDAHTKLLESKGKKIATPT